MAKARRAAKGRKAAKPARKAARKTARKTARKPAAKRGATNRKAKAVAPKKASPAKKVSPKAGTPPPPRQASATAPKQAGAKAGNAPWPTRPSAGTGAGVSRSPYLERERKRLREVEEEEVQGPPSSLDLDRHPSAARTGREELREALRQHTETSPALTGGDVDADWQNAYSSGEEAPGGDNPTPDQQRVDDIGKALGVEYQDNEELRGVDKIDDRDKKRWELDPASAEDYKERQK
jgi:hypothetical protein